ncbi:hypothetical protein FQN57_000959 [Myotisia sp. PD_48]|nr:hypothetical protein FQN57_000959 [Myotisia sp. PD_48]
MVVFPWADSQFELLVTVSADKYSQEQRCAEIKACLLRIVASSEFTANLESLLDPAKPLLLLTSISTEVNQQDQEQDLERNKVAPNSGYSTLHAKCAPLETRYYSVKMAPASTNSTFRRLQQFKPDYSSSVFTQYESERTGMRVVVVDQKGPKVCGYFVLATEIHDDSGSPHTLEHLCFMGSRNYQYKGFLDKLATRLYSDTNACTATDYTYYTLETAGWDGFSMILPVYLEHIIAPTLTDAGCYTEVYHVDGAGHDAGVVYSEMQGVQNTASSLIDLESRRLLYPEGVGFRYETGGMMEQLRVLTSNRIREFHREMYQPKNLCLVITGEVDHSSLIRVLDTFEDTILDVIPRPDAPFTRPWVDSPQVQSLQKSVLKRVEFPDEDESFGEIEIRFLGPDCNNPLLSGALNVALLYLAGSSASLLENTLVEKEQVATAVYYDTDDRPRTEIRFTLTSVATDQLEAVEHRFFEVLRNAMQNEIDLKYMRECIQRHKRSWKFATENSVTEFIEYVISDFLFGKRDGSTLEQVGTLQEFDVLEKWTDGDWRGFISKWISDAPHVSILGVPSAQLSEKLKEDTENLVKERKLKLGEEGLKKLQENLEKAKAENEREIPKDSLAKFVVPDTDSIHFIHTISAGSSLASDPSRLNNRIQKAIDSDGSNLPLFVHFENIPSNFVTFSLMISTVDVPVQLLPLLSVYIEAFFNLPVLRDGQMIAFEEVVVQLERDTVGYRMTTARGSPETLSIVFQVEVEKYQAAISWLRELTWNSIFDVERLVAITTKLLSDVPETKRSGSDMLEAVRSMILQAPNSIGRAKSTLVKARYLKRIKKLLASQPEDVVSRMEEIRKALFRPENFRILVIADVEKLKNPISAWKSFIDGLDTSQQLRPVVKLTERFSDPGKRPGSHGYIVPMPTIDTSYANSSAKGPDTYNHPKLPALMVAVAYLNAVEGPLWVAVRGTGLAYGASFRCNVDSGLVTLLIYQSPNAHKAFEAGKAVIQDHLSGAIEFDPLMALEGAISSIVAGFAAEQETYLDAGHDSFIRQVIRGLPSDYNETMLKKLRAVGISDIKDVFEEFMLPVFNAETSNLFVTCAPVLEASIKSGFEALGYRPEVRSLRDFEEDYGLKVGDEDEEEEDDDDDDEEEDDDDDSGDDGEEE